MSVKIDDMLHEQIVVRKDYLEKLVSVVNSTITADFLRHNNYIVADTLKYFNNLFEADRTVFYVDVEGVKSNKMDKAIKVVMEKIKEKNKEAGP